MKFFSILLLAVSVVSVGCAHNPKQAIGTGVGAAVGAGVGALAGHKIGGVSKAEGAVAGAVVGGLLGNLLGRQGDKMDRLEAQQQSNAEQLALPEQPAPGPNQVAVVNVKNKNGSSTPVELTRVGTQWVGPRGEHYDNMPTIDQLQMVYGF